MPESFRIVFYRRAAGWAAHCVDFDVLGTGRTREDALRALLSVLASPDWGPPDGPGGAAALTVDSLDAPPREVLEALFYSGSGYELRTGYGRAA